MTTEPTTTNELVARELCDAVKRAARPSPTDIECPTCNAWVGWACKGEGYGYHAAGYHPSRVRIAEQTHQHRARVAELELALYEASILALYPRQASAGLTFPPGGRSIADRVLDLLAKINVTQCQICGDFFRRGPTSRDHDRFANRICGGEECGRR